MQHPGRGGGGHIRRHQSAVDGMGQSEQEDAMVLEKWNRGHKESDTSARQNKSASQQKGDEIDSQLYTRGHASKLSGVRVIPFINGYKSLRTRKSAGHMKLDRT